MSSTTQRTSVIGMMTLLPLLTMLPAISGCSVEFVGGAGLCSDGCRMAGDGYCDDGGADSRFAICDYGTDCSDCGPRPQPNGGLSPDAGGSDDITVINHGALEGADHTGVPHCYVFDHEGTFLWRGNPHPRADGEELDEVVKEAVADLPSQS